MDQILNFENMMWKDWLYFSKGEKRALWLLTVLLGAALFLLWSGAPRKTDKEAIRRLEQEAAGFRQEIGGRKGGGPPDKERQTAGLAKRKSASTAESGKKVPDITAPGSARTYSVQPAKKGAAPVSSYPVQPAQRAKKPFYPVIAKYAPGTVVELNTADTVVLKKVPGIGSVLAYRIVKYRRLLHGFVSVEQLREVYGIDEERYAGLAGWFEADRTRICPLPVNRWPADSLRRHPYISFRQARAIERLRVQKGRLSGWENLMLLEEFTEVDRKRLRPYLSFE